MKIVKAVVLSFLTIIYSIMAYGVAYDGYGFEIDEKTYFYKGSSSSFYQDDIRIKALTLMDMIDKNKNKTKKICLSVLLEIELNILETELTTRIEESQKNIATSKEILADRSKKLDQDRVRSYLNSIDREEDKIRAFEEALYLTKQWKRDYCK
jgi:hypothetical protein